MEPKKPPAGGAVSERNRADADGASETSAHERVAPAATTRAPERRRHSSAWQSKDVLRATVVVLGVYFALRLIWIAHILILAAFLGVLFGLAVTVGVDRLEKWRIPRGIAAAAITFGSIGLVVAFFAWSAPALREQSRELETKLPQAIDKVDAWLEAHRSGVVGFFLSPPPAPPDTGAAARRDSTNQPGQQPAAAEGTSLRDRLLTQLAGVKRYFFGFLSSTLSAFGGLLLVIFLAIYVAAEPDTYHDGMMHLFPHPSRKRGGEVLTAIATALKRWLVTQLLAMIAIGTITTVVLLVLQVRGAFALGVMAGLLEFVPTVGPILSAVPAIAMGFVDSPEKALWVALAYGGIQFVENHLLIPLLMKGGVNIPPALTILAQALMALLFGFLGLLVAVPMLAAVMVAVKMLYVEGVVGDPVTILDEDHDE